MFVAFLLLDQHLYYLHILQRCLWQRPTFSPFPIQLELDSRRSCGLDLALPKAVTRFSAIWISTLYILRRCLSSCHLSFSPHTTGARQQSLLWVKPRVARTFPSQSQFSRFSESDASHLRLASVHRRLNITCSATGISTVNMFTKPHFFT